MKDDKTGETLSLQFVEIHQPVRHLKKDGQFFVCTDFRKPGSQDECYDIDFWVNQKTGKLAASVAPTSHNDPKRTFEKVRRVSPARRRP